MNGTVGESSVKAAVERARCHAPFLKLQLDRFPAIAKQLDSGLIEEAIIAARSAGRGLATLGPALRRQRSALALALGVGDLAGVLPLERVVGELSDLADTVLERALGAAMAERTPDQPPRGFAIIALGKHGSRELNYSSDVDLLFLFDPEKLPLKPREEAGLAAVRIGQRVIELVQMRDQEGYVFRVDLRLRPSPEITPIALPVEAAISYYETTALPWERAAFIRARAVAGDAALSRHFLEVIHPFIWRRSLDFGAIGEIQSISRRIRDHYSQGQRFGPGFDLKRGRGGIREIEFFAQIHQLIHGGRDPGLRAPATLDALSALVRAGHITAADEAILAPAYRLFRTIEHRLQMVDDKQTHRIPAESDALDNIARLHGLGAGHELLALLEEPVARVGKTYDALNGEEGTTLPLDEHLLEGWLRNAGFDDSASARLRIESWRSGKARSLRAAPARDAFEAMLPALVGVLAQAPDPMAAMNRFDDLVMKLPSGVNFYRLLEARPALIQLLATLLSHAPVLAEQLGLRPELLDGLIDASAFDPAPSVAEMIAEFSRADRGGGDYQLLLDTVRRRVNERRFALGAQLIVAYRDPIEVGEGYSRVAEAALAVLASAATAEFQKSHGCVPESELLILGLGRLGGEALTHASDLDLVYLFSGTHEAQSDGPKPLRATDYFNRLAVRVSAALSVPTAAGPLYEVDTRLRPSGTDGLLAVSIESFARYQSEQAWTWEHMALARSRPVYGSTQARAELQAVIDATLRQPRDTAGLVADVVRMRAEIAAHKPANGLFDIKLGEGGLVDLEFAIHTLQLRHRIGLHPRLERALAELEAAGLVGADIQPALDLLTRMLVTFRLVSPNSAEPAEATKPFVARACGAADWKGLLAAHEDARQRIAHLWRAVTSETGA